MTDQFVVDCYFIGKGGTNIHFQNRRLKFAPAHLEILSPKPDESPRILQCTTFQFKILKAGKKHLIFPLVPETEKDYLSLKMTFKPEHEQFIEWVTEQFNKMIKENKDKMQSRKPKSKQVPLIVPTEAPNKDIYQIRPIYNEKNCLAELERQKSESRAMNISPASQQTPPKQSPNLEYMKQLESRSDAIDSCRNTFLAKKKGPDVTLYKPEKSNRSQNASPMDFEPLENPVKRLSKKEEPVESFFTPEKSNRTNIASPTDLFSPEKSKISKPLKLDNEVSSKSISPVVSEIKCLTDSPDLDKEFKENISEKNCSTPSPSSTKDAFRNRRLENTGNSCYFNATMQALSACYPLVSRCRILKLMKEYENNFFENQKHSTTKLEHKYTLFADMLDMMSTLSAREEIVENKTFPYMSRSRLTRIRQNLGRINHDFDNDNQQDAHEYLITLLGSVDDVMEANRKKAKTMQEKRIALLNPSKVFECEVETLYACQFCNKMEPKSDYRTDLCLNVSEECSVPVLLSSFSKWSPVEKECSYCKETLSSACDRISKFPPSLIINLKLYEMQGTEGIQKKKDCFVNDAFKIDLSSLRSHTEPENFDMNQYTFVDRPTSSLKFECDLKPDENGNASQEESQNDIIIESVKKPKDLYFELLTDIENVKEILGKLNIAFCEKSVKSHLNGLKLAVEKMSRSDSPGETTMIRGDGNCFYRAISWCLTGSEKFHRKLRLATAEYLKNNEENLKKYCKEENYENYVEKVRKNYEWAVSCEIFAMANLLNVEILTFLDNRWVSHIPRGGGSSSGGSIYLNNKCHHYEPTTSLSKSRSQNIDSQSSALHQNFPNKTSRCGSKRKADENETEGDTHEIRNKMHTAQTGEISEYKIDEESCETTTEQERDTHAPEVVKYNLVAVVCHLGDSPHRGHYVAYTKVPNKSSKWIYCSDNEIEEVPRNRVESAIRTSGYVLFYDRQ